MFRNRVYFLLSLCSLCFLGRCQETRQDESCACTSECKIADRYIQNGTCRKENVALGKVATMSERFYEATYGGQSGPACLANNGNMNREYLGERQEGGPRCIHTTQNTDMWWQVDLGRNYTVSHIAVYGREYYPERMPTSITVNEQSIYTGMPNEIDLIIDLSKTTVGRTVNVSTDTAREFLNICQVQVWVDQCSCISDHTASCSPEGHCRMDNVALGKVAYMSSVYVEQTAQAASQACLAVDGNPGLRHNTITSSNCIMSSSADDYPWWEVDLGQDYTINKITVYTMESYLDNMKGVEISVDGQTCYTFSNTTQPSITNDVKCSQARKGKFVTFTSRDNKQLVLCEVQIWVCSWGFYGESCKNNCGKCNNATCDVENGTCPTRCELGFTGPLCQETCGHCLNNSTCNPVNGACDEGCVQGFAGHSCKECAQGYYGNELSCIPCGNCINGSACNYITGDCDDCENGWQYPLCNVCDDKHYDSNCSSECGHCFNNECNKLNGICNYGCEAGWWNSTCKDECPVGFYGRNCEETCGRCLNISTCDPVNGSCAGNCLPGSRGTFCSACINGSYGQNCFSVCGKCANAEPCDKVNGQCLSCEPGLKMPHCQQACNNGTYGPDCSSGCGNCKDGVPCDKINGACLSCEPDLIMPLCQQESAPSEGSGNTVGPIVGAIVGGFIILSISLSVTIVVYLRRYKSRSADSINTTSNVLQLATDTQASIQPSKKDESATEYDEIGNPYDSLHPADDSENHNYASHATEERKIKSKEDKPFYVNAITKNNF